MTLEEKAVEICKIQVGVYIKHRRIPRCIDPEDLFHEAVLRALRYIHKYDPAKGQLNTFLQPYSFGAILDFLRKIDGYNRGEKTILVSLNFPGPGDKIANVSDSRSNIEGDCIGHELPKFLEIAGRSIPPDYWKVVSLFYFDGKEVREICKILGLKDSRVHQMRRTGLSKLKRAMNKKGFASTRDLF